MPRKWRTEGDELTATISVRISARTRFGILLMSRKGLEKPSEVVQGMLSAVMKSHASSLEFFHIPDLDELWDPVPWVRLQKLREKQPRWVSSSERVALEHIAEYGDKMDNDLWLALKERFKIEV